MFVTTGFSFRTSIGKTEDIISRLKELDYKHAAVADIESTWNWTEWKAESLKQGLRPVYAVQIAVSPNPKAKKPVSDYWIFVARDSIRPINEALELATTQFRYQPLLSYEDALAVDAFIITGHTAQFDNMKPQDNLFVGLSAACSKGFVNRAIKDGYQFAATQNNRYVKPEDEQYWQVICGRNAGSQTYAQYILSEGEWFESVKSYPIAHSALDNLRYIMDNATADLPMADLIRPKVDKTLREMCIEGAGLKNIDLNDKKYLDRLNEELTVIHDKKFEDYFFVVADLMQFARKNMLCGPGRGSSAGSLVCYLLDITNVDPIKYDLLFFRFLDPSRPDWPDIDGDLNSEKRHLVFKYLEDKYGKDRFAQVGALAYYQTTNSLNEVCKALGVPRFEANKVEEKVQDYAANDKRRLTALKDAFENTPEGKAFIKKYPFMTVAADVIGNPTHSSAHAGGVILTNEPMTNYVAVDRHGDSFTAQIDKDESEKRGLIKIDLLGLKNLAIFEEALNLAGLKREDLEKVALDDQKAFDVLNDGKFKGTFQFEGKAVENLTREITVESLEDLSAISALARPGPLSSGAAGRWVKKRTGRIAVDFPHDLLRPYLEETHGELIYQEQIMLIAKEVAGMDWKTVSKLRKAIGKSQGESALKEYGDPFIAGLVAAGIPQDISERFWKEVIGFGSYGFNRCLAGSTKIKAGVEAISIEDIYNNRDRPWLTSLLPNGNFRQQLMKDVFYSGEKACFTYRFDDGSEVICTPEHKFLVNGRWIPIIEAEFGDQFKSEEGFKSLVDCVYYGIQKTYDIEMPTHHNFMLANGLVTHNSHSISYAMVSYWSLWLKAYYPVEFAAASLSFRNKVETQIELLRELAAEGIEYIPVDVELSTDKWQVSNGKLIGPISLCAGIGPKMVQQILSSRARGEPLPERAQKLLTNAKTAIDELWPVEKAISKIDLEEKNIKTKPTKCVDAVPLGFWQEGIVVIGCVRIVVERDENEIKRIQDRIERGQIGEVLGQSKFIELRIFDDTGEIYAKIGKNEYFKFVERTKNIQEGRTLLCVKGTITPEAPVLLVKDFKIIGEI